MLHCKAPTTAAAQQQRCQARSSTGRLAPIVARRRLVVADAALKDTSAVPVMEKGELSVFPEQPAVYAVYDKDGAVQYIGLTRKVNLAQFLHPASCWQLDGSRCRRTDSSSTRAAAPGWQAAVRSAPTVPGAQFGAAIGTATAARHMQPASFMHACKQ